MGIDFLDVGYRIEKEFNIHLANDDYEKIRTVGDLEEVIASRMTSVWPCPHIPAFSRLSAGLAKIKDCSESEYNLDTILENMTPPLERVVFWQKLEQTTGLKLPALQTSATLRALGCSVALLLIGLPFLFLLATANNLALRPEFFFALLPVSIASLIVFLNVLEPLHSQFANRFEFAAPEFLHGTLRDLTRAVASMNREKLVTPISTHYEPIWPRLVSLIEDVSGVDEDEVIPTARFIEDLGF